MNRRLVYRRQFLLTRQQVRELADWNQVQMDDYYLYAHPDLEVTRKERKGGLVLLIGYIFDPRHPAQTNEENVRDILSRANDFAELINALKPYTGRYAMIYRNETSCFILHDAYGVREIYYCTQKNRVICGSQPNLVSEYSEPRLQTTNDEKILRFYKYEMKPVRLGRLWVGDETYYQDIKHLMPNHCLDIKTLKATRYWPNKRLETMDLPKAVQLSCDFLKGAMSAVTTRYKVMMAVTAGYDSRSLLAASRDVRDRVYYFINKEPPMNERTVDIRVPREMLNKLGIPFHIHDVTGPIDEEFKTIFLNNTFWAIEKPLPTIYNVYFKNHQDKINLLGLGEIGRVYYGDSPPHLDGYYLARSLKYRRSGYAVAQCEKWLREAKGIAESYNFDIMKLFLWEFLIANWGAIGNSESDIAIEEFDPYSSHYILEILLSVDQEQGDIFKGMFKEMWPELLCFKLNPPSTMSDWVKEGLNRLGLLNRLKRAVYRFDRWRFRGIVSTSQEGA
jgi:hypothetical protein